MAWDYEFHTKVLGLIAAIVAGTLLIIDNRRDRK